MVSSPQSTGSTPPPIQTGTTASGGNSTIPNGQSYSGIPTKTSRPKELIRHDISDEELVMLVNGKRDGLSEALWAFVGGILGSISPAIRNICAAYFDEPATPLSPFDLIEVVIFFGCVVLTIGFFVILRRKGKTVDDLVSEIRARKKS